MTLPTLRRRASLSRTALLLVAASASACAGKRPTFGPFVERDAGDSDDETETSTTTDNSTTDGGSASDETYTDETLVTEDSSAGAMTTDEDDTTSPQNTDEGSVTDGTEPDETRTSDTAGDEEETDADSDAQATDDGGVECSDGHFADGDGNCQLWAECGAGTYIASAGSATSDQQCATCEEGTYSDVSNADACSTWDHCGWFETSKPATETSNVECLQADKFEQFGTAGSDGVNAMAADASGRVVVAGSAGGALYSGAKGSAFARMYDAQGQEVWTRQFGEVGQDYVAGVSFEPGGDVIIAGSTYVASGDEDSIADAFVARLASSDGEEVWRKQFGTGDADHAVAIATDAYGTSVVVGTTAGGLSQNNLGRVDVMVRQYGSTGEEHWTRQFGTTEEDIATGVAIGPRGEVAIVGQTLGVLGGESAGGRDGFLRVYTSDATSHRTTQFGGELDEHAEAVTFTPNGDIAVVGYAGRSVEGMTGFLRLYRLSDHGEIALAWVRTFQPGTYAVAISASASGDMFVAGYTLFAISTEVGGWIDGFVFRYDAGGELLGSRQFGSTGTDGINAAALAGGRQHVLVAGTTNGDLSGVNAGANDAFVGILDITSQLP